MKTDVYLIRHGIAAERGTYAHDDERPLTDEGDRKTRKVAQRLHELQISFDLILTSPLVRARQTADILKEANLASRIEISGDLSPDGDVKSWLVWLAQWRSPDTNCLALVGHQPDLSNWAEILAWGSARNQMVLKKAGIIAMNLPADGSPIGRSRLFWLTPPRFLL
ncbi:MAG TPA: phosphohistidine phosphatase SixA [Elainellaceae cyanobacterium]